MHNFVPLVIDDWEGGHWREKAIRLDLFNPAPVSCSSKEPVDSRVIRKSPFA